jgi:hypothetical protein
MISASDRRRAVFRIPPALGSCLIAAFGVQTQIIQVEGEKIDGEIWASASGQILRAVRWTIDRMRGVKGRVES